MDKRNPQICRFERRNAYNLELGRQIERLERRTLGEWKRPCETVVQPVPALLADERVNGSKRGDC